MRIMTIVLAGTLAIFIAGGQAVAAKRISNSGVANPDRQYYQQAGSCGGESCSRSASQKHQKKK
jgi:general stress protein YciG